MRRAIFLPIALLGFVVLPSCGSDGSSGGGGGTGGGGNFGNVGNTGGGGTGGSGGTGGLAGSAGLAGSGGVAGGTGGVAGAAGGGGAPSGGGTGGGGTGGSGNVGGDATIIPGATNRFLLIGTVVTPDTTYDGQVLVESDTITCAAPGTTCAGQSGATGATVIDTNGIIAPGLIDTHNHILFDIFDNDDWVPQIPATCSSAANCSTGYCSGGKCDCVDNVCRYKNHNQWPAEAEYGLMLDYKQCLEDASQGKPIWCPQTYDGTGALDCEMDKWGELKGMIAGTTSIVGLPGTSSACFASLSRSIDVVQNDLPGDKIQTSAIFPPSASSANGVCSNFTSGATDAYLIHVGEGVDSVALNEFSTLNTVTDPDGCLLAPKTTITHGTAFTATQFQAMATAGMKLTWSPASNVALYGKTTDIPAAMVAGVTIALGPDWSMGGSQNMLDELRFADNWDNTRWGDKITTKQIVQMATKNGAAALGLSAVLGSIAPNLKADLFVVGGDVTKPYDAILAARPKDVRLVMVGGVPLFGDDQLKAAGPANPGCETQDICGRSKFLCVAEPSSANKLNQTYVQIKTALDNALLDLDNIAELPAGSCSPACSASQGCFKRTSVAQVAASACNPACGAGQACFQTSASNVGCLSVNACAPKKTKTFTPVAPVVKCN
ncbi:MAG: amidohydrolase family protein [Myxococcales bacterium]|nr:amidohydrolase family protein [Myxococcales bacterium]